MNWVATVTIHCADRCVGDKAQKDGILSFRGAHFLRLTQRNLRSNSAAGISRLTAVFPIQRVLNPPGGAASP